MGDNKTLKSQFVSGVLWGIVEKLASLLTGFVITLVLARILTPADYGLVNMIYIFTVLGTVLLDGGLGQAIIQRKNLTASDISSVFYINLVMSFVIYAILYFCTPLIADFYGQPELINISRVVFLTLPINALCIIQHSLLTKELRVKSLTYVSIISALVSGAVGITMAYLGFGVWSLVVQSLAYQFVRAMALWRFSDWRPILKFNFAFIKSIWGFSMNLLGVFSLAAIFQNIYTLLIGKLYNVNDVGYYNQAFRMQSVASNAIMSSIQRVAFPAFTKLQDDMVALRSVYKRVTIMTMEVYFPVMMTLMMVGRPLFSVLLTDKWLPSVPLFGLLCISEAFFPLNNINSSVLKARGKGKKYFRLNLVNYGVITLCIFMTYSYGIIALLCGYAVSSLLRSVISMIVCGREIQYGFCQQLIDLMPTFLIALLTCIGVYGVECLALAPLLKLIFAVIVGSVIFLVANFILKTTFFRELKQITK